MPPLESVQPENPLNMLTHRTKIRVIYGDTDNMGMAYHANYMRWFEIGRTEMFREWGMPYRTMEKQGLFLPVSEMYCKFVSPAKYDDRLTVETTLDTGVRAGMKFDYTIYNDTGETVLAHGFTKHACLNRDGNVVRPPKFLKDLIRARTNEPAD